MHLNQLPNLLTPLPIYSLIFLAILAWQTKKKLWWLVFAWAYLMSIPMPVNMAASWLENQYRPIADLDPYLGYPVVLLPSGTKRMDAEEGWVNRLAESGWERLLVATDTARQVGGDLYITGGPATSRWREPMSVSIKGVIERMGIDIETIKLETAAVNTYQNLAFLKDQLIGQPFILVTSASHLPRAMAVADKLGLEAIPQPADYLVDSVISYRNLLPSSEALLHWRLVLHEVVGHVYYALKGYL